MQPPYDVALREAVRLRMSPPNRETVAEIARDTEITAQAIYNWRSQWRMQGLLVPASSKASAQWSAANGPSAPSMADQRELSSEKIRSKRVRSANCSVNWIRRKRHSQKRQRC
jgi:transposase-like protein